jgi:HEAT repeat protein
MIERAVKDDQTSVRITAWGALAMLGRAGAWEKVREGAGVKNPEDRGIALKMLGALRDRRALPVLEEALADPQPSIRGAAAMACGDLGAPKAGPWLIKLMADPLPPVRVAAALSLGELRAADAVPILTKGLHDPNAGTRAAVVSALLQLGRPFSEVEDTVRELTRHTDPGVRASAARAVAKTRGAAAKDAEGILRMLLSDPLPRPKIAAARALGHTGGDQARDLLKQTLRDEDDAVRATAAGSLIRVMDVTRSARKHDGN